MLTESHSSSRDDDPGLNTFEDWPVRQSWALAPTPTGPGSAEHADLVTEVRALLDTLARSRPDAMAGRSAARAVREARSLLDAHITSEAAQVYARRLDLIGRGQVTTPVLEILSGDEHEVAARVRFGRFYLGSNGAVHGGAICLVMDELLGQLANIRVSRAARTAYLNVSYLAIAPIDTDLRLHARVTETDGRKKFLAAALCHGEGVCARADALFVVRRPDQS